MVYGDQHRYLQILLNFLSNAIKFTPQGGTITIQTLLKDKQTVQARPATRKASADQRAAFASQSQHFDRRVKSYIDFDIRIEDSGCGISKDNLSRLFMNFGKLDEHSKMNHRGTGLGLSICKSLIELMGGAVSVESDLGQGTTFVMSLKTKCKLPSQEGANFVDPGALRNLPKSNMHVAQADFHDEFPRLPQITTGQVQSDKYHGKNPVEGGPQLHGSEEEAKGEASSPSGKPLTAMMRQIQTFKGSRR